MVHSLEHLEGKIKNVQARKRKLACKNETLLSKLEEVKDNLSEKVNTIYILTYTQKYILLFNLNANVI